jgi:hypothetical protein
MGQARHADSPGKGMIVAPSGGVIPRCGPATMPF